MNVLQLDASNGRALAQLGEIFYREGQTYHAAAVFLRLKELQPTNSVARLRIARLSVLLNRIAGAREEAVAVLEQDPDNEEALLILSEAVASPAQLQETEDRVRQFSERNGDKAAVHVCLGRLALLVKDLAKAESELLEAQRLDPRSVPMHLVLGMVRWAQQNTKEADEHFKAAVELAPNDWSPRVRQAEFQFASGAPEEARGFLEQIIKEAPQHVPALVTLAKIAFAEKKFEEVASLTGRVIENTKTDPEALLLRAQAATSQGDVQDAIKHFKQLCDQYPQISRFHYHLALSYLRADKSEEAAASLKQAIALEPLFDEAILLSATLAIKAKDFVTAASTINQLLDRSPDLERAYPLLADAFRGQGMLDRAIEVCQRWAERFPASPQAPFLKGLILRQQQNDPDAREAFEAAGKISPEYQLAIEQLIDLDLRAKKSTAALGRAEKLVAGSPQSPGAHILLAKVQLAQEELLAAESSLVKALELDPASREGGMILAQIYLRTNKKQEALEKLQAVVEKHPGDWAALLMIGLLQQEFGDHSKARTTYEKVLELNPKSVAALNNLAYLFLDQFADPKTAWTYALRARELAPEDPSVADTLGWSLYHRGEFNTALPLIREAANKLPSNPEVHFHLATIEAAMGEDVPARVALEKALDSVTPLTPRDKAEQLLWILKLDPLAAQAEDKAKLTQIVASDTKNVAARRRLAAIATRDGDREQGLAHLRAAVETNPKSVTALLELAQFYSDQLGDHHQASEQAKLALELAPNNSKVCYLAGRTAFLARDYRRAHNLLEKAVKAHPDDSDILLDFALATYNLGMLPEAQRAANEALAKQQSGFGRAEAAKQFLSMVSLIGDPSRASSMQAQVEEVLARDPENIPALMAAAIIMEQSGQAQEAQELYENRLLKLNPSFAPAWRQLAQLYARPPADYNKVFDAGSKARAVFQNDPQLAKLLGQAAYHRKDYQRAVLLLSENANEQSTDAELFYSLGMAYHALNRKEQTKSALEKALALNLDPEFAKSAGDVLAELQPANP